MTNPRAGTPAVRLPVRSLAAVLALACAGAPAHAGLRRTDPTMVAAACETLAADVAASVKSGGKASIVFDATVRRTESDGATMLTFLCAAPGPIVVCTEYRKPPPPAGSRVRVHGIVSGTWDKGLVLDPCDTTRFD